MAKLVWHTAGDKLYETGVSDCALFPRNGENGTYGTGVAWNGIQSVSESPSGAEPTKLFADNNTYLTMTSLEELSGTIEAYMCPPEFYECDGTKAILPGVRAGQQTRTQFGIVYKTLIGNDIVGTAYGYKLHVIYGMTAAPTERTGTTVNDSPEAATLSWEYSTNPVTVTAVEGVKPTANLVFDSTEVTEADMKKIIDAFYGTADTEPKFLLPDEIYALLSPVAPPQG